MNPKLTFEQWVIETYGKSVYQIELYVAQEWTVMRTPGSTDDANQGFAVADNFINALRNRWLSLQSHK
jgi:hypothetical protein